MFLGSGGIVFFDQSTSVLDLCTYFLDFCEDESCGRCTTCFQGTQRALEILRRIGQGGGRESDYEKLNDLIQALRWSNCLHGQFAPTSVKLALNYFRDEFEILIKEQRDPTQSLPGLIQYQIKDSTASELEVASELCPTDAIVRNNLGWKIDDAACIRCDACREVAPLAIEIRDRFEIPLLTQ